MMGSGRFLEGVLGKLGIAVEGGGGGGRKLAGGD
jgi:hypothetical protein